MASPIHMSETLSALHLRGLIPESIELCLQCQKCASGCPVAYTTDYTPPQLLMMILLGLALDIDPEKPGLNQHMIDPMPLLAKVV